MCCQLADHGAKVSLAVPTGRGREQPCLLSGEDRLPGFRASTPARGREGREAHGTSAQYQQLWEEAQGACILKEPRSTLIGTHDCCVSWSTLFRNLDRSMQRDMVRREVLPVGGLHVKEDNLNKIPKSHSFFLLLLLRHLSNPDTGTHLLGFFWSDSSSHER